MGERSVTTVNSQVRSLNDTLYADLPIGELEARLALEELEDRAEMQCVWDCPNLECVIRG